MTALITFAAGALFAAVVAAFVLVIDRAAQAAANHADRKNAARDAASTFCADFIPDSSEILEHLGAERAAMRARRGR